MGRSTALLPALGVLVSCAGDPMVNVRQDFAGGRYQESHDALSRLAEDDPSNEHVYRLERGIVSMALGRPEESVADLRAARDRLDELHGATDYLSWFKSVFLDDRQLRYEGADYEVVMVRALLALADLGSGNGADAAAYALQVAEKQQEIIGSFEAEDGRRPKEAYKLVAFGSYLRAILDEERLDFALSRRSFERVKEIEPRFSLVDEDLRRVTEGHHSEKGNGVIWVLAMVGRGPFRVEAEEPVSGAALATAQMVWAIVRGRATIPNITAVKIPAVAIHRDNPTEVHVSVDGGSAGVTETVTDVNLTALREFEAMKSQIVARAVVRRAFKIVTTEGLKEAASAARGRRGDSSEVLIDLGISALGLLWTGLEGADLRCWSLLPAQLQVLRVEVPAGEHEVTIHAGAGGRAAGPPQTSRVLVRDGFNTYVIVLTPTLDGGPRPLSPDSIDEPEGTEESPETEPEAVP